MRRFPLSTILTLAAGGTTLMALVLIFSSGAAAGPACRTQTIVLAGALSSTAPGRVTVAELEKLPQTEMSTYDPYQKRRITYQGVLFSDLVTAYGTAATRTLLLKAIDAYQVEFTRQEWSERRILLAVRQNDRLLTLRENGPAKIVMPMVENDSRLYAPKWIWLVNHIEFLE